MVVIPARVKVVVVMVSALALAAGLLTLTLLSKPAQAQAETVTDTDQIPLSFFAASCSSLDPEFEFILFEGTLQTVAHTTMDANGGFHTKVEFHIWGQGEGLSSGDKYVFNDIRNSTFNSPTGAVLNVTQLQTSQLIRQGSATPTDDLQAKTLVHISINAQGELTAEVRNESVSCT
jgi:hypothetical protein